MRTAPPRSTRLTGKSVSLCSKVTTSTPGSMVPSNTWRAPAGCCAEANAAQSRTVTPMTVSRTRACGFIWLRVYGGTPLRARTRFRSAEPEAGLLLIKRAGAPRSPQRIRISCYAAPNTTACAAFIKESRMKFANETNLDRKSGVPGLKMNCFECSHSIARPSLRV